MGGDERKKVVMYAHGEQKGEGKEGEGGEGEGGEGEGEGEGEGGEGEGGERGGKGEREREGEKETKRNRKGGGKKGEGGGEKEDKRQTTTQVGKLSRRVQEEMSSQSSSIPAVSCSPTVAAPVHSHCPSESSYTPSPDPPACRGIT